jgi:hypothetical protein
MTTNLDGKKNERTTPSSFDESYMYCCLQLKCDKFNIEIELNWI